MRSSSRPEPDTDRRTDAAACKKQAMNLLARREHSRLELERKLAARHYAPETVAGALDDLERAGLLSDERFAESFVRARAERGHGPRRIQRELVERGIDGARAGALVAEAEVDWRALAAEVRAKRFGSGAPGGWPERARQARFLDYRGFDRDQIDAALELAGVSD